MDRPTFVPGVPGAECLGKARPMNEDLDALVRAVAPGGTLFQSFGELTWRNLPAVTQQLKRRLARHDLRPTERRKSFSAFIELAYNVLHYAAPLPGSDAGGLERRVAFALALGRDERAPWIAAANLVGAERARRLSARLDGLRAIGAAGARESYRSRVTADVADRDPESKGEGLGLLTLARAASRPLDFAFAPADAQGHLRFHLRAFLS